mgnify:CR=1 FL=1
MIVLIIPDYEYRNIITTYRCNDCRQRRSSYRTSKYKKLRRETTYLTKYSGRCCSRIYSKLLLNTTLYGGDVFFFF